MKHFLEYLHPHLKLRLKLYNDYMVKFKHIKNKHELSIYCSKYDFNELIKEN